MPHFENLDQYETNHPKSGKRHIVPIAPHSLQAADYHPGDEGSEPPRKRKRIAEFSKMDFEPVSIRQMEKEFKAAGRKRRRSHSRRKRKSLWKRLTNFIQSLFGKKSKQSAQRGKRTRPPVKGGPSRNRRRNQPKGEQKGGQKSQHPKKKHFKKRRSGKNRNQSTGPNQQQKSGQPRQGNSSEGSGEKPPRKRNRRNRRRRQSSGQNGNPQSGNQNQG